MKITVFLSKLSPQGKSTVIINTNTASSICTCMCHSAAQAAVQAAAWLHGCLLSCRHEITISRKLRARGANLSYYFHQTENRKKKTEKVSDFSTDNKKQKQNRRIWGDSCKCPFSLQTIPQTLEGEGQVLLFPNGNL